MILTLLGVSLGVAVTIAVDLLCTEILAANRRSLEAIAGKAELTVTHGEAGLDRTLTDRILHIPGVAHVDPLLEVQLMEPGRGAILLLGLDFLGDKALRQLEAVPDDSAIIEDPIAFLNSTSAALVPKSFAARRGLKKGDRITLMTPAGQRPFVIKGLLEDRGPAQAFAGDVVVMYLDAAQVALKLGERITRIDIGLQPHTTPAMVRDRIKAALGPGYSVDFPSRRGAQLDDMMASMKQALYTMAALAIWVGILLAYNAVDISVRQRKNELAILRAIGTERQTILRLVLAEALVMGIMATTLGIFLGYFLAQQGLALTATTVNEIYTVVKVDEVILGPRQIISGLFVGLIIPLIGAIRPARWLANQPPVVGLQRATEEIMVDAGSNRRGLSIGIGLGVIGVGLFAVPVVRESLLLGYLAFGGVLGSAMLLAPAAVTGVATLLHRAMGSLLPAEMVIGLDHVIRDRRRSALNVASLVAGVATVVTVASYVTSFHETNRRWIESSVPADLFVISGAKLAISQNIPIEPGFGDTLRAFPGVDALFRVRIVDSEHQGRPLKIVSVEMREYRQRAPWLVIEGKMVRDGPTDQGTGVMINETLARRANLQPGSQLLLETPAGPQPFTVEAVVIDFSSDQGVVLLDRAPYVRLFRDDLVDCFDLFLKPGVDPLPLQAKIKQAYGERYNLFVLTNAEVKAEAERLINQIFALLNMLQLVTLFIAILGVSTTLGAAVLDRTQEIGVLRAVGSSPGQIMQIVLYEAAFIGAPAALLGIAVGLLGGYMFMRSILIVTMGWTLPWLFPLNTCLMSLLGVTAASVLAGLYPAWWSARQPTLEALRNE
jgi:putative ABC transport system permease protein